VSRGTALIATAVLAALAAAPASAKPSYQLRFSGTLSVTHDDSGLEANDAGCALGTPANTSPFEDHYTVGLSWTTSYKLKANRKHRLRATIKARTTRVLGTSFSYQGYAYDFGCHEIVYGPGGTACTGTIGGPGPGAVDARLQPVRASERIRLVLDPFGSLVATPTSCTVDSVPAVTYAAGDELGLAGLGGALDDHPFNVLEPGAVGKVKTIRRKIERTVDCSQPAQSADETDTCSTAYSGSEALVVRPG
jgi:hypothetical protein